MSANVHRYALSVSRCRHCPRNVDERSADHRGNDQGLSGVDPETLDKADVVIEGVDVDRIEVLPDGRVRYWYGDDGDRLPYGPVQIELVTSAIQDRAGNGNAELAISINHAFDSCGWQNVAMPVDTTGDDIVASRDVLVVINEINRRPANDRGSHLASSSANHRRVLLA